MLTIRQVRELVAGLIHQMPDSSQFPGLPRFFGDDPTLEATVGEYLASLPDSPVPPAVNMLLPVKLRLMFAAECLRQMEEEQPDLMIHGPLIPEMLRHWMIDLWPEHGKAWAMATFGPRRMPR